MFSTPILLIVFNRPKETKRVFEVIRRVRPSKLFIAGDGPRLGNKNDLIKCREVKNIVKTVDWHCKVHRLFQKTNLGCGLGPVTAINWFFENVKEGIILEDDCIPSLDFFRFCSELLDYYKNNEKVMHISGDNFQYGKKRGIASYYFSEFTHSWGWATWKRAWKYNDYYSLPEKERRQVWDKQWMESVRRHSGLAIIPNTNLVSNIGFGKNATHTKTKAIYTDLPRGKLPFPLLHPDEIRLDRSADSYTTRHHFGHTRGYYYFQFLLGLVKRIIVYFRLEEIINTLKFIHLFNIFKGYTMIPRNIFIGNLKLIQQFKSLGGCVVECGVWRGGMIAAMARILGSKRKYYLLDSFEGLPPAKKIDGEAALRWQRDKASPLYFDNCKVEEKYAHEAMVLSGVKNYQIIKGWFSQSLPKIKFDHNIAVLRLDVDWYDSTMECLIALYDHVVKGGIIIIDDYYTWDGCAKAVHRFLAKQKNTSRLHQSEDGVCYILKIF